jgi:ABC-type uncharacterized transport system ATPase subunit
MIRASGKITMKGSRLAAAGKGSTGKAAARAGIAHVPEDRHHHGLILDFTAWENVAFGYHNDPEYQKNALFMDNAAIAPTPRGRWSKFDVRPPIPTGLPPKAFPAATSKRSSSRARWSATPTCLLIGQPTRGVDIGAIEFIHNQIIALRDAGKRCCWSASSWTRS